MKTHIITIITMLASAITCAAGTLSETDFVATTQDTREALAALVDSAKASNTIAAKIKDKATADSQAVEYSLAMLKSASAVIVFEKAVRRDALILTLKAGDDKAAQDDAKKRLSEMTDAELSKIDASATNRVKDAAYYGSESLKVMAQVCSRLIQDAEKEMD